ncbi:DUF397 domain-containing protein [Actinomadura sp. LD22]|uniref:DUF397 domain-containing protein n=1 Tax=Actinomadura physcomitrii TaxID=2650748 RepID=A0A6I4MG84_9ACTN|nr:DUF397 domain-containing protein [Actinomadura physcomitrii]MWA04723.1 DUF397 domain-containing protein [Actinomadura physcomitrii]
MRAEGLALRWRKSSRSDGTGGECVELAVTSDALLVRDSKDPEGPQLTFTRAAARALIVQLREESR